MSFKPRKVEYNGTEKIVLVGNAKLKSQLPTSEKSVLSYDNAEGVTKNYKLANIAVDFGNGQTTDMLASVPEKIYANNEFKAGESYLTTIEKVEDRKNPGKYILLARMSALSALEVNEVAINHAINNLFEMEAVEDPIAEVKLAGAEVEE
jgi:hypothetical protein